MLTTLSELFAIAHNLPIGGPHKCFFCGCACGDAETAATWVKATCTVRQYAKAPQSQYVCRGCAASMNEKATVHVFGEEAPRDGKRVRNFSWVVTPDGATPYTKSHIAELQRICINPPEPPFGIVLADSGQKHLIWMGLANHDRQHVELMLEDEQVSYVPAALAPRIVLAEHIAAAAGKPCLAEQPSFAMWRECVSVYGDAQLADEWAAVWAQPLSRLAAFLSRGRKDLQ